MPKKTNDLKKKKTKNPQKQNTSFLYLHAFPPFTTLSKQELSLSLPSNPSLYLFYSALIFFTIPSIFYLHVQFVQCLSHKKKIIITFIRAMYVFG